LNDLQAERELEAASSGGVASASPVATGVLGDSGAPGGVMALTSGGEVKNKTVALLLPATMTLSESVGSAVETPLNKKALKCVLRLAHASESLLTLPAPTVVCQRWHNVQLVLIVMLCAETVIPAVNMEACRLSRSQSALLAHQHFS
jgi:hypothetical protein